MAINEEKEWEKMKKYPVRYAYTLNDSRAVSAMASIDKNCAEKIKRYYEEVLRDSQIYIPACRIHTIQLNDNKVHVLAIDKDSLYAEVAHFYKSRKGTENVLLDTLSSRICIIPAFY